MHICYKKISDKSELRCYKSKINIFLGKGLGLSRELY